MGTLVSQCVMSASTCINVYYYLDTPFGIRSVHVTGFLRKCTFCCSQNAYRHIHGLDLEHILPKLVGKVYK